MEHICKNCKHYRKYDNLDLVRCTRYPEEKTILGVAPTTHFCGEFEEAGMGGITNKYFRPSKQMVCPNCLKVTNLRIDFHGATTCRGCNHQIDRLIYPPKKVVEVEHSDNCNLTVTYTIDKPTAKELNQAMDRMIEHIWGKQDPKEEPKLGEYKCPVCSYRSELPSTYDSHDFAVCCNCDSHIRRYMWKCSK